MLACFFVTVASQPTFAAQSCKADADCAKNQICEQADKNSCGPKDFGACQLICKPAPPQPGKVCTGTGNGTCGGGLVCVPPASNPNCARAGNRNSPQCLSHCQYLKQGQTCTGSGQSNCSPGLLCKTDQNKCKTVTLPGGIRGQQCQTDCQKPLPTPTITPTPPISTCAIVPGKGQQGTCQKGFTCTNWSPQECAHLGVMCGACVADTPQPSQPPPPPLPPCAKWTNGNKGGVCESFVSAFGNFPTDPEAFIQKIFAILLSISGGIALLLIIKAGYQLMISQGKPEQIQQARDQLIAAIVGLIFLIFSFVFLQLIGFNILHIPGFIDNDPSSNQCSSIGNGYHYCSSIKQCFPASSSCP